MTADPSPQRHRRVPRWLPAAMCLALAGCGVPWDSEPPEPEPTRSATLNTIARLEPGDRHVLTASVGAVLGERAFVVHDVDLPEQGLLVLTPTATDVRAPVLVTADGVIRRFAFDAFRVPFGLSEAAAYQPYEGRKVLVAGDIRSMG
jgi:hypothetical protein